MALSKPVWDSEGSSWSPLPPLDRDVECDVCVVGLGASGLQAVLSLLERGVEHVVGIDAQDVGAGAAGRNGGFLLAGLAAFHHDAAQKLGRERAAALYRLTLLELDRIFARYPGSTKRTGSLRIAHDSEEEDDCRRQLAAMQQNGLPARWYDGSEGRGIFVPTDGTMNPLERCRTMAAECLARGANLYGRTPAIRIEDGRVATSSGTVSARRVVVAVDPLARVFPEMESVVRTVRLQMLSTAPVEPRFPLPVYLRHGFEYFQQLADGRIAVGGFRDAGGDAEYTTDAIPSSYIQERIQRFAKDTIGVDVQIEHRWAASVGYTSTGLPFVGKVRSGVWAVGGYCGTGNIVGCVLGRELATIVAAELDKGVAEAPFTRLIGTSSLPAKL